MKHQFTEINMSHKKSANPMKTEDPERPKAEAYRPYKKGKKIMAARLEFHSFWRSAPRIRPF
jgi:hypothetical protein